MLESCGSIRSFGWGALMRMRQVEPRLPIVALTNGQQFLQAGQPRALPWVGGIDIDNFPGSLQHKLVARSPRSVPTRCRPFTARRRTEPHR
jgi:glycerophosphoryl diester phosphodiesterase